LEFVAGVAAWSVVADRSPVTATACSREYYTKRIEVLRFSGAALLVELSVDCSRVGA
jgi:hypothetical protein